eukprot:10185579-Ditylum_brightwellii.AAC.1
MSPTLGKEAATTPPPDSTNIITEDKNSIPDEKEEIPSPGTMIDDSMMENIFRMATLNTTRM